MADRYNVVIVGGGIMDCSSAFHLARRGLQVALLEKHGIEREQRGIRSADSTSIA